MERIKGVGASIDGTLVAPIDGFRKSSRMSVGIAEFGKSENVPLLRVSKICQGGTESIGGWEMGLDGGCDGDCDGGFEMGLDGGFDGGWNWGGRVVWANSACG